MIQGRRISNRKTRRIQTSTQHFIGFLDSVGVGVFRVGFRGANVPSQAQPMFALQRDVRAARGASSFHSAASVPQKGGGGGFLLTDGCVFCCCSIRSSSPVQRFSSGLRCRMFFWTTSGRCWLRSGRRLPSLSNRQPQRPLIRACREGSLLYGEGQRPEGSRPLRLWRGEAPDDGGGPTTIRRRQMPHGSHTA